MSLPRIIDKRQKSKQRDKIITNKNNNNLNKQQTLQTYKKNQNIDFKLKNRQKVNQKIIQDHQNETKKQVKYLQTLQLKQKSQSMPKLSSKQYTKRQQGDRYIKNQQLSMLFKLPVKNNEDQSDQQQIKLYQQENKKQIQPIIYVIKKNKQYEKIVNTQIKQEKEQINNIFIQQKLQVFPKKPIFPTKYIQSHQNKIQKYIKQKLVGEDAINMFYNRYKNIQKIRDLQKIKYQFHPLTAILTILQNYNIPPKKMQLVKLKGHQAILDLKNCALGSTVSIKAVSEILQKVKNFEQIDLSCNNISQDMCEFIIPNLSSLKKINLSYNKIGRQGVQLLSKMIEDIIKDDDKQLMELNLQSNNINDTAISNLFNNVLQMKSLLILNLSKNNLGNFMASRLKQFLLKDVYLTQLYLHWCDLGLKATKSIFQGMVKNKSLKVLDLSWNQIGLDGVPTLCSFLKYNKSLIHLDISFCQIDEQDSKIISKSLYYNHTIYGFHYQGNNGIVDFKGYLHPINKQNQKISTSIRAGLLERIQSVHIVKRINDQIIQNQNSNVCWICQGWIQKYFKIQKKKQEKGCFIHLSFELYKGVLMIDKGQYFEIKRMCPPISFTFFYTKLEPNGQFITQLNENKINQLKKQQYQLFFQQLIIQNKKINNLKLSKINKLNAPKYYSQIFDQYYQTKINSLPRSDDLSALDLLVNINNNRQKQQPVSSPKIKQPKKIIKKPPVLKKQIQIKTIPDNFQNLFDKQTGNGNSYQNFIKNCVQFDIKNSKVTKIIKNQKQLVQIKSILQHNYQIFQKVYYYLINNNPNFYGVYSISEQRFQKFIQEQNYQTKRVTKAKIRLKLITCLTNQQTDKEIQGFYRPQFFQFLLRLAMQKWCVSIPKKENQTQQQKRKRQKYPLNIKQAFQKIIKSLRKYEDKADSIKWRQFNLTTYQVNVILKTYQNILQQLYDRFAGITQKNLNTKTKKKMLLDQFKMMMIQAGLRKTKQSLKDLQIAYRISKKIQIQDGISDTGLVFQQYLQCFCRFAQGLQLKPISKQQNSIWDKQPSLYNQIPLFLKIQSLIKQIYSKIYDIQNKKSDLLLSQGLFSQQVSVLIQYFIEKSENSQTKAKNNNIKMNSLQGNLNNKKINLNFLIQLLRIKSEQIRIQNNIKLKQHLQKS